MNDDTVVALRVIGMIREGQKVSVHDGVLIIEQGQTRTIINSIMRWINGDNRNKTINYIKNIVNNGLILVNDEPRVIQAFQESLAGISALKVTYADDAVIVANLNVLEDKIKWSIKYEPPNISKNEPTNNGDDE
jgi:hypothetical protein